MKLNLKHLAALAAILTAPMASSGLSGASLAAEESLPAALQGLGLTVTGSRERDHGKREIWLELPDGSRLEAHTDRHGEVEDVEAVGRSAALPRELLERLLPAEAANHPNLAEITRLREIEVDDDGEIEVEGYSETGGEIKAEFDAAGRLVDFDRD